MEERPVKEIATKTYDLEPRTQEFARKCRILVRAIVKDIPNKENGKQLTRSSGSVAANYIEANRYLMNNQSTWNLEFVFWSL